MLKRFVFYSLRWQLSTPVLAPIMIYGEGVFFPASPTANYWAAVTVANFVGSCIFFWVDRFIFKLKLLDNPLWEVKENAACGACGKQSRCYRLFKAKNYDRTEDKNPVFLCEICSKEKVAQLRSRGVVIP